MLPTQITRTSPWAGIAEAELQLTRQFMWREDRCHPPHHDRPCVNHPKSARRYKLECDGKHLGATYPSLFASVSALPTPAKSDPTSLPWASSALALPLSLHLTSLDKSTGRGGARSCPSIPIWQAIVSYAVVLLEAPAWIVKQPAWEETSAESNLFRGRFRSSCPADDDDRGEANGTCEVTALSKGVLCWSAGL